MKNSQNNEAYFETLLESAIKEYKTTKRYLQLQEGLEEKYVYLRAYIDCVKLLKRLKLL